MKENIQPNSEKRNLSIVPSTGEALTKSQDTFNRITLRIEQLEKKLKEKEKFLEDLIRYFSKKIDPFIELEARNKIKTAFLVEEKMLSVKLSKKAQSQAEELIICLLNQAFLYVEANKEEIALYNRFSDVSYEDEKQEDIQAMKSEMEFMFASHGIEIDLTDVNIEDEAEMARLMRVLQDKIQANEKEAISSFEDVKNKQDKKKTKKELQREAIEKAKEEAQSKSLKSIYISLSKALHPDMESDPELKFQKEELMKKVTVAYQEKNFPALLELEMEWIHQTSQHLKEMNEDKLQLYISILSDREKELLHQTEILAHNPKFHKVQRYANFTEKSAYKRIDETKKMFVSNQEFFDLMLRVLSKSRTKQDITYMFDDMYFKLVESVYFGIKTPT